MNEKLFDIASELSMQASDWVDQVHPHVSYRAWHNHHRTRLAELIIKETIKSIQATSAESINLGRTLEENVSWTVNDIKRNFGINE